ncbi:ATP-binding protein [Pinirhizobacter sp.]|jgi:hypothetical protein|uniref:ATP-binding protein n=1 Tax=Pinirhizobacter sp. TaxID=2950432 RepID=UPI002F40F168
MDPIRNPFSPGAGAPPPELAGREALLARAAVTLGRIKAGRPEKSFLLVGLRGVGKTVLLNRIAQIAEDDGFRVVFVEAHEGKSLPALLVPELRRLVYKLDAMAGLSQKVKRSLRVLRSFVGSVKVKISDIELGIDVDPEAGTADSGDIESDLSDLFLAIGEAARERNTAVALVLDELQYLKEVELSALIMAMHRIAQKQLPLVLIGAGLPQLVGHAGKSKSYAERLFDFPELGPLDDAQLADALQAPARQENVAFTDEAIGEIARVTKGYPYFLQEWAYQTWNLATESPIGVDVVKVATQQSLARLDASFFRVRLDRTTPREKEYMIALARLGPGRQRSGEVADLMGADVQTVAPLRNGLIKKGMIFSPAHGDTEFTVPLFDEFMMRTVNRSAHS